MNKQTIEEELKVIDQKIDEALLDALIARRNMECLKDAADKLAEALENMTEQGNKLMDYCINRQYLDNEDFIAGQENFQKAVDESNVALANYKKP